MATHDSAQDAYPCDYCGVLYTSSITSHCQCLNNHRFEIENEIERLNSEIERLNNVIEVMRDMFVGINKELDILSKRA